MEELKKNQIWTGTADGYTSDGSGVFHIGGRAVFVPGAIVGERWEIRILRVSSSAVYGRGETLLSPSPERVVPDCSVYPKCGGCALRHMSYEEELAMKLRRVNDALRRIGGLDFALDTIVPAEEGARMRRKVIFNIGSQNGQPTGGFFRARSHDIVPLEDCPAVREESRRAQQCVLDWMKRMKIPAYDEAAGTEGVRHLFYRSSHLTENAVITLVVSRAPKKPALDELCVTLRRSCPEMSGLVLNVNTSRGNTVLAGEFRTLWGDERLTESLCGLRFSISPRSFFQVNPPQAEKLYTLALEYAEIRDGTLALDLYCGTGTIGLCMAARGARVIGAEVVAPAVENARENARMNHLETRCEFLCADAGEAAAELRRRELRPEVIVVDPPRKGLSPELIDTAAAMEPDRIVYVSCDPGTLARDLKLLEERGYHLRAGTAVDLFPRTEHVETVCALSKLSEAKHHISVQVDMDELDLTAAESKATYEEIQEWVQEKYGFHVTHLNIAQVKRKHGIIERENYNKPKSPDSKQPGYPEEKARAIEDALKHFQMI
ncbi:MAG: 23S rRNA (uracil(1939)-C(5))-methyltransferase RlmD [Oscillospiraceae bacterium]|nr:23S rRNA (uracil(1939)-C(5))-methyltransferase RlmD [Oscillospiraceae bacterium]